MLLTTLVAELLGACCLAIGLINPAVYEVPTEHLTFFGFWHLMVICGIYWLRLLF